MGRRVGKKVEVEIEQEKLGGRRERCLTRVLHIAPILSASYPRQQGDVHQSLSLPTHLRSDLVNML